MNRYFLEVRYKGSNYAGFQKQRNARTIQSTVEEALAVFFRQHIELTGSSRTDAGVHALQNYFHFDLSTTVTEQAIYNMNALLPPDIAVTNLIPVLLEAHCRYDAIARSYNYRIYNSKDPFLEGIAYYFPYKPDLGLLQNTAELVLEQVDFKAFSKRNTQVTHFRCTILESRWEKDGDCLVYHVKANRFLRGMVRGLAGTMLQVARRKMDLESFRELFHSGDATQVDFSVPGHGLLLRQVHYPDGFFDQS